MMVIFRNGFKRLRRDAEILWEDFRPHGASWFYLFVILLIMVGAVLIRLLFLDYPMRYDESYTVTVFAVRPWLNLISDYSLPNNHVFHTILVKLSTMLLGTEPWMVRLPAFIHGILCIPAGYLLSSQLYGRKSAVLSAGLMAALPIMINYSTNARGYSQYMFYSLLLFSLAIYLSKHFNFVGWGLFILIAVLGFYTIPVMLFPFGGACLWLVLSAAFGEIDQAYGSFGGLLKIVLIVCVLVAILTICLYSPVVLIGTGLESLTRNLTGSQLNWHDFWLQVIEQLGNTWRNWHTDLPLALQVIQTVGIFLSLVFHKRISRVKVPTLIAIWAWNLVILVGFRITPMDRIWLYLVPFRLIWACGGFLAVWESFKRPKEWLQWGLVVGCLVITAIGSVERVHRYFPAWQADPGKIELASEYINENLSEGDAIAVVFPYDAQYWYYLDRLGVEDQYMHQIEQREHRRVFAVLNHENAPTVSQVLIAHNLDPEAYQADQAEMIYKINDQEIYLCIHR